MSTQYGLIIPKKDKAVTAKPNAFVRPAIFDEESDSDDEASKKPTGLKKALKKQDRVLQEKAMEEDPTIFQYDEVYDDIDEKRKQSKLARKDIDRKPKYISKLLQAADRRKRDNERRIEREVQRERDAEGEEFKDKESFVTSAYRKKLEEMKELEEKEKREEYLESIGDVRKQGNLDGFYRHLYDQKVNFGEPPKGESPSIKVENETLEVTKSRSRSQSPTTSSPKISDKRPGEELAEESTVSKRKKRKYRNRKQSGEVSSDDEKPQNTTEDTTKHIQSNLDADSDFDIDSSSGDEEQNEGDKASVKETKMEMKVAETSEIKTSVDKDGKTNVDDVKSEDDKEKQVEEEEKKPKIDIWKKRTEGVVFEEALQRYFQRKSVRESNQL